MVICRNCGRKTEGDYCQWCGYPVMAGGRRRAETGKAKESQMNHTLQDRAGVMKDYSNEANRYWLQSFMRIYNEASPLIDTMTELNSEGQPANPASLHEGYPELLALHQSIKDMPKPSDKELRKVKDDFEKTVSMCMKAQEMTMKMLDDVDHGAKLASRMHLASLVGYVNYAATYRGYLIKRLTKIGVF
jgi:ribosomal protein L37E